MRAGRRQSGTWPSQLRAASQWPEDGIGVMTSSSPQCSAKNASKLLLAVFLTFIKINLCRWDIIIDTLIIVGIMGCGLSFKCIV